MNALADAGMAALAVVMVALVSLGASKAARLGGRDNGSARRLGLTTALGLSAWLAFTAVLAASGFLSVWTARPPRWPLLPLSALITLVVLQRTATVGTLLGSLPRAWPVAAQSFRVAVELVIFALHAGGRAPVQITFEGRNFDILVGLTAPVVAWLLARNRLSAPMIIAWNVLGIGILANTVATVASSTPGPLHYPWPGEPFTAIATWPVVWLPALLAPMAVFLHVVSIRQALASRRASVPLEARRLRRTVVLGRRAHSSVSSRASVATSSAAGIARTRGAPCPAQCAPKPDSPTRLPAACSAFAS